MDTKNLKDLENNAKLKQKYYAKGIWKNYAFVPPTLIVFIGLFGLLYLFKDDLLISFYSIPFALILLLGAIWIKSTKRYLINQRKEKSKTFVICKAVPLTYGNSDLIMFASGNNRHNNYYIEKKKNEFEEQYGITDRLNINELTKLADSDIIVLPASKLKKGILKTKRADNNNFLLIYDGSEVFDLLRIQKK